MDTLPLTATALGRFFHIKGSEVERYYKHHLSDYDDWEQKEHAADWILLSKNMGKRLSIDETQLCGDVYTILTNKDGKGRKNSIITIVRGTKAEAVSRIIKMIAEDDLNKVEEITMDFSDSMYSIARQCFPNAIIVIDCFHIVQRLCEGLEEMRLRFKRLAVTETKKAAAAFMQEEERKAKQRIYNRAYYRKRHKKNSKDKRGRKRIRKQKFKPQTLSNGDTKVELLTRSRNLLSQSGDKWGEHKKERAKLLFKLYPQMLEGYSLICKVRSIFKEKITVKEAKEKLHEWYAQVNKCTLREIKSARECLKSKEEEVLNYFINRATNASAESINSKLKGFKAQLHGVADIPFFIYRVCMIFG